MANTELFEASQNGDAGKLRDLVQATAELDINAKDSHGMTALGYGARNGHVEVVQELLARGAEKNEVVEQGYGLANAEIAPLLGQDGPQQMQAGPVDVHGGRQLPDGTISYLSMSEFPQGYPMPAHMAAPQYYDGGMQAPSFAPNGAGPQHSNGHGSKDPSASLPPPDISRMIPCKFFPNCRYGDQCVFAHPVMGSLPPMPPQQGHPLSPPMSPPPAAAMQPIFYQQMPPGYPYPPYGAGPHQHYMPMAPPMGQYGMPPHFAPSMLQPQQQQQMQQQHPAAPMVAESSSQSPALGDAQQVAQATGEGESSSSAQVQPQASQSGEQSNPQESAVPEQPAVEALAATEQGADATAAKDDVTPPTQPGAKPVHRRQSFNSFLHHHAVPFQPQNGEMLAGYAARGMGMGPVKGRRSGFGINGANGIHGKKNGHSNERPPCTFFAAGRCRFGDECRFPHILADGTDARPIEAQQRQVYNVQYGGQGNPMASRAGMVNGAASTSTAPHNGNASAPASAPTGPQADKKAQQQQQKVEQQPQSKAEQAKSQNEQVAQGTSGNQSQGAASSSSNGNGKASAAMQQSNSQKSGEQSNVVRSNPSKTSSQAAAAAAAASRGNKKNAHKHDRASNNQQQQQPAASAPHQRVPTVNDFPALSPGLSTNAPSSPLTGTSTAASVETEPTTVADSTGSLPPRSTDAKPVHNSAPAAAPRVNFSAILSAPAPPKPKPSPQPAAATAAPVASESTEGKTEADAAAKPAEEVSSKPMTAAAALAAAPNGNAAPKANGSAAPASKPQQASNGNGRSNSQKPRGGPRESNGSAHGSKAGAQNGNHRQAQASAPAKGVNSHANGNATASDDDFQLVNRSRSHNKRATQNHNNGASTNTNGSNSNAAKSADGFAAQAKTVAA